MNTGITLFYASLLAVLLLMLSVQVVRLRRRLRIGLGSGSDQRLELAIRAQANFCEYVPLALLLLVLIELNAMAPAWALHVLGVMLVVGRVLHGLLGLNRSAGTSQGRFWGTAMTWLVLLMCALIGIASVLVGR